MQCSVEGCALSVDARGWCSTHYSRWRRTGSPVEAQYLRHQPDEVRFWHHVDRESNPDGCWEWTGSRNKQGYGRWAIKGVGSLRAHRMAYQYAVGPIPSGAHIRHHCDNPPCCRPDHLATGSRQDNTDDRESRGRNKIEIAITASAAARRAATHCARGHEVNEANARWHSGKRHCRPCQAENARRRRATDVASGGTPG